MICVKAHLPKTTTDIVESEKEKEVKLLEFAATEGMSRKGAFRIVNSGMHRRMVFSE
jgi:hypothetical protein